MVDEANNRPAPGEYGIKITKTNFILFLFSFYVIGSIRGDDMG